MCAPSLIAAVREDLSRRRFLGTLGASVAAAALASPDVAVAQQRPVRLAKGFRDVFDLTHTLSPTFPVYPSFRPIRITAL